MANDKIKTVTSISGASSDGNWIEVTGTDVGSDPTKKRALDTFLQGGTVGTVPSGLKTKGLITEITLNDTTFVALPTTALTGRSAIGIQNPSGIIIKLNFIVSPGGFIGWNIGPAGEFYTDITDAIEVFARATSGTPTITIMELS